MLTEKDLLIDIIQNAPDNSIWNISSDSWEKIPTVFYGYISDHELDGWSIIINRDNRKTLVDIIDKEEIFEKVGHLKISLDNIPIFISYDCMAGSYLSNKFPRFIQLIDKYQGQETTIFELKV